MDRRTTIQWMLAAGVSLPLSARSAARRALRAAVPPPVRGYGADPNLMTVHQLGTIWPLTLTVDQRRLAGVLSDIILPADVHSPGATDVGVVDFIDEWVSAPYPDQLHDRPIVLAGLVWLDEEAQRRSGKRFVDTGSDAQHAICDDICDVRHASAERLTAAQFFALYRDLTAGGYYSTPVGRNDLGYIGNVALGRFDGPPPDLLKKLSLP